MVLRPLEARDRGALYVAYSRIVEAKEGFPHQPPLGWPEFFDYWLAHTSAVVLADAGGEVAGAYYLKPNFVGRAAHIANAGYFVSRGWRGEGLGRRLLLDSFELARRLGFDALQFNLVFASNPARSLYEELGFAVIGRLPRAVEGEDALVYWRSLEGS